MRVVARLHDVHAQGNNLFFCSILASSTIKHTFIDHIQVCNVRAHSIRNAVCVGRPEKLVEDRRPGQQQLRRLPFFCVFGASSCLYGQAHCLLWRRHAGWRCVTWAWPGMWSCTVVQAGSVSTTCAQQDRTQGQSGSGLFRRALCPIRLLETGSHGATTLLRLWQEGTGRRVQWCRLPCARDAGIDLTRRCRTAASSDGEGTQPWGDGRITCVFLSCKKRFRGPYRSPAQWGGQGDGRGLQAEQTSQRHDAVQYSEETHKDTIGVSVDSNKRRPTWPP